MAVCLWLIIQRNFYPADMPLLVVRSPWGLIGDCYPTRSPSVLWVPGWWPGGLIPYPYWYDQFAHYQGVPWTGARRGRASKFNFKFKPPP